MSVQKMETTRTMFAADSRMPQAAVAQLIEHGELAEIRPYAAPKAAGGLLTMLLSGLLSAEPDKAEPIEDAHGGVPQNLSCAMVF